jgi:hypothetical protein
MPFKERHRVSDAGTEIQDSLNAQTRFPRNIECGYDLILMEKEILSRVVYGKQAHPR